MDYKAAAPILENFPGGISIFRWDGQSFDPLYVNRHFYDIIGCEELCQFKDSILKEDKD